MIMKMLKNAYTKIKSEDHLFKKKYSNYEEYISHQKEKTEDPERRKKWLNDEWDEKYNYFFSEYKYVLDKFNIKPSGRGLGLGARTGQEVKAMLNIGYLNSIGIDLVPCEPLVIEGDIHDLPFKTNEFSFAFTNIYDHSLYPDKFLEEIVRTLAIGGIGVIHLQVGMVTDDYGVVDITSTKTIENKLRKSGCDILCIEEITQNREIIDMSTRIVFQKR
jgi:SAM-dependent methyltransferase